MLFIGIDVAKSKYDCCIINSNGVILTNSLRISNTKEGFDTLYLTILSVLELKIISLLMLRQCFSQYILLYQRP